MIVETLLVGLAVALVWAEVTDVSPGGIIVPGYYALYLGRPLRVAATLAVALLTLAAYRLLARRLVLFGRRRFVLMVLLGAVLSQAWLLVLPKLFMLRYRTRDITRLDTSTCACGRTHARILRITGRDDDMLIIRGVNVYPSQIEAVLVGLPGIAPHYQLVVERSGSLDELTVEVEAAALEAAFEELEERVRHQIKSMIGVSTKVVAKKPGEVPRRKARRCGCAT